MTHYPKVTGSKPRTFCLCPECHKARHRAWRKAGLDFPSLPSVVRLAITENA